MKHKARKRFGQNFLTDKNIITKLINTISPKDAEFFLEIGPGLGALTLPLLEKTKKLQVIELDRNVIPILAEKAKYKGELNIISADVLKVNFSELFAQHAPIRCVGNLPYNISSPIIFHLLTYRHLFADMHFMLQKEMVDRIVAKPGTKTYGRISVMVQYFCLCEKLFYVPPTAFDPPPKVESAIIYLKPKMVISLPAEDETIFSELVRDAFGQRRKTLGNALKKYFSKEDWDKLQFDSKQRAENLSVDDFVKLTNYFVKNKCRLG